MARNASSYLRSVFKFKLSNIKQFPNASNANQNKSLRPNTVFPRIDEIPVKSELISVMLGIGYFVPRATWVGPKIYPLPRLIAVVWEYKSVMNFGKIAARMFCNALLANAMDDSVAGGANSAPCDFIKDINSSQFIFCYSIERFIPICAAI